MKENERAVKELIKKNKKVLDGREKLGYNVSCVKERFHGTFSRAILARF